MLINITRLLKNRNKHLIQLYNEGRVTEDEEVFFDNIGLSFKVSDALKELEEKESGE